MHDALQKIIYGRIVIACNEMNSCKIFNFGLSNNQDGAEYNILWMDVSCIEGKVIKEKSEKNTWKKTRWHVHKEGRVGRIVHIISQQIMLISQEFFELDSYACYPLPLNLSFL